MPGVGYQQHHSRSAEIARLRSHSPLQILNVVEMRLGLDEDVHIGKAGDGISAAAVPCNRNRHFKVKTDAPESIPDPAQEGQVRGVSNGSPVRIEPDRGLESEERGDARD